MCKGLWDGVYGLSSLSERTRKSNRLQMLLQRQHFFLSYLKTLSVGPAGFEPTASRLVDRRLPYWANRANNRGRPDLALGNHSLGTDSKWCSVDTKSHTIDSILIGDSDFFFVPCSWHVDHIISHKIVLRVRPCLNTEIQRQKANISVLLLMRIEVNICSYMSASLTCKHKHVSNLVSTLQRRVEIGTFRIVSTNDVTNKKRW